LVDYKKLDSFFSGNILPSIKDSVTRHTKLVRRAKLILPCIAAALLSLLFIIPALKKDLSKFSIDITRPKAGELEKLHVENTVFYITDRNNNVHNFTADSIDETEPQSKLVRISNPEGILPVSEGVWLDIKSPTGYYNQEQNTLTLTDDVEIFYSAGMNIQVPYVVYDFRNLKGHSSKPVKADGFLGKLDSEGFEFYSQTGVMIFKGKTNIKIKKESLKR
jgi:hypothetical protein